jgi:hypothetical protein
MIEAGAPAVEARGVRRGILEKSPLLQRGIMKID